MKVLQINSVCGVGSTGRIAADIDNILRKNNIESYVAYGRKSSIINDHIIKIGTKIDYHVHAGYTRLFDTHALSGSERATHKFIQQIEQIDPDVIHLHNLHGYYINVKILFDYLRETEKPVVWTLHDCWSFTGHCAHFTSAQCEKWITGCQDCPQKKSYPASIITDNSQRNYQIKKRIFTSMDNMTIVTPSHWLAQLVSKSFLAKIPVRVIHNGINTQVFKPVYDDTRDRLQISDKFVVVGVTNGWNQQQRLSFFMELSSFLDEGCVIVLVGVSDKQKAILPSNIIGIKWLSGQNELVQIYSMADVFINPTIEDNFPTVNLEALACGTPVITFNTGGSPETIDASCGYGTDSKCVLDTLRIIDIVRINGKKNYSNECVARVKGNFETNDRVTDYKDLYLQIAEKRQAQAKLITNV